jgi:hypothetical protein
LRPTNKSLGDPLAGSPPAEELVLTSEIADYDDWNPQAISARQERLSELAVKAWPDELDETGAQHRPSHPPHGKPLLLEVCTEVCTDAHPWHFRHA